MTEKRTIGKLIEKEVRKQQLSIVEFADRICCKRNNVYNLFTRNNMDIQQLALISKVLGRNFFKELSEDLEFANETDESEEDIQNRKAVSQFMEVAPRALRKLNASPSLYLVSVRMENTKDVPSQTLCFPIMLSLLQLERPFKNVQKISIIQDLSLLKVSKTKKALQLRSRQIICMTPVS